MIRHGRKDAMHPRNRFRTGYDFAQLVASNPTLAPFVAPNPYGDLSIDYANPSAVKALNRALLAHAYGVRHWDVPPGYLCPPIPGRSDYLHHLADLLAEGSGSSIPRGPSTRVLDIGVGASCIYPLIGASEYGWRFVGSEIDREAVDWARHIVAANPAVANLVECRVQPSPGGYFQSVIAEGEEFAASMCNPPFHASAQEAAAGSRRKNRNLGQSKESPLNFGGRARELWCDGGELGFVRRMIAESAAAAGQCHWFTTLVSRSDHVPPLVKALQDAGASEVRTLAMAQGHKQSRILALDVLDLLAVRIESTHPAGRPRAADCARHHHVDRLGGWIKRDVRLTATKLHQHLFNLGLERHLVDAIVGALAQHERFDHRPQRVWSQIVGRHSDGGDFLASGIRFEFDRESALVFHVATIQHGNGRFSGQRPTALTAFTALAAT